MIIAATTPTPAGWHSFDITGLVTTQAQLNALRTRLIVTVSSGTSPTACEVDEIYLEQADPLAKSNTFEGGSNGTALTALNTATPDALQNFDGTPVFSNAHTMHGTLTMAVAAATQQRTGWIGLGNLWKLALRQYIYFVATPSAIVSLGAVRTSSGTTICSIKTTAGGKINVVNGANNSIGTVNISAGLVRIEWLVDEGAGTVSWRLFNSPDSTTPDDSGSLTTQTFSARIDQSLAGSFEITGAGYWIDDFAINSGDWLGPVATGSAPTVTSLSPSSGPTSGGTSITITGTNLTSPSAVSFGGTPAASFTGTDSTHVTATSPAHAVGVVDVTVTTASGTSATGAGDQFTYIAASHQLTLLGAGA